MELELNCWDKLPFKMNRNSTKGVPFQGIQIRYSVKLMLM